MSIRPDPSHRVDPSPRASHYRPWKWRKIYAVILAVVGCSLGEPLLAQDEPRFIRADANQDGHVDLSDPIATLLHLFQPGFTVPCEKAADADDSGALDITDAIYGVSFLFRGGTAPPAPFPACGFDGTADGLSCAEVACPSGASSVILSEILASNDETLADEDGEPSDWIELHLPSDASDPILDLGGFFLTTRTDLSRLWRIPDGATIERGGFLVIFASGKDRRDPGGELHTDFKLAREGEYLALVGPDGATILDEFWPTFPEQIVDVSYGPAQSSASLVVEGATARYRVPASVDSGLGTSWTEPGFADGAWKSGPTGIGFTGITTQGFEVTYYKASVLVDHLSTADQVTQNPQLQSRVVRDTAEYIDFFNTGGRGNYDNDRPFPGISFGDVDDFVIVAEGTVNIPQAGAWSFGVNSDDGFGLELENGGQTFEMEHAAPRGPSDTIQIFNIPRAGPWNLRLLYYERGGGAGVEFFAAPGSRPSFDSRFFRLVGDTANGGLGLVGFADEIRTNVEGDMRNENASIWMRLPFEVENPQALGGLALEMKYADGFVAFLNGIEVASRNAPATLAWNSQATDERSLEEAAIIERINLTDQIAFLEPGENILAIQGLNDTASDGDFLIVPRLIAAGRIAEDQYMTTPTPGAFNVPGAIGFIREVQFSEPHGFYEDELSLELSTDTPGAQIRYTLDGSTPTKTHGTVYSGPITIERTTVVRAAAFREGYLDSRPRTQSYLFVSDIIRQSPSGQSPGPGWPTGTVNGQELDYGMDPDIVNHPVWSSQIEDALLSIPSIVIATDVANLFSASTGIYVNAGNDGRAWERPVSAELIDPDGAEGFSVNAGLRIRGAFSRSDSNPKHSFRLFFRKEYGPGRLEYPLFGGEGAEEFDKIDLRTSQNYSWAFEGSEKNTFMREVFSRDVQRDMNQPYTRSRYYHLYLNGQYWGLYMTQERVDAVYAETYFGGAEADYDVIKNDSSGSRALEASDGTINAYRDLYEAAVAGFSTDTAYYRVQGLRADGTPDPNGTRLVDVQNLMDYMVCTYYTGDPDAPVSAWAHFSNNIFAVYNRNRKDGFKWFRHDAEHSLGANGGLFEGRLLTDPVDRSIGQQWQHFNPAWLHLRLTAHPEYALAFADRVAKHFFNGGALTAQANIARWNVRKAQIEQAVIGASARWGDSKRHPPRTKNDWLQESNWLTGTFFPQRNQIVINQMRSVNMFPDAAIVTFNQPGGRVDSGFEVLLSQSNGTSGTIYYTTDGADPRMRGGTLYSGTSIYTSGNPIRIEVSTTIKARVRAGSEWGALAEARFVVGLDSLVLNEIMAANTTTLEDPQEPGEYPDWIELYNGTDNTIDLGGMFLSDYPLDLKHWRIPDGLTIGPGEFLVFFADDDGTQGPLHTNFQLSKSGEIVILVDTDGSTILDLMVFDQQIDDISFGRFPDGTDDLGFHASPTPGSANSSHVE